MDGAVDTDRLVLKYEDSIFVLGYPYDQDIPAAFQVAAIYEAALDLSAAEWRYFEIYTGAQRIAECLIAPENVEGSPPTAAIGLLLRACSAHPSLAENTDDGARLTPGKTIVVVDVDGISDVEAELLARPERLARLALALPEINSFEISRAYSSLHAKKSANIGLDALAVSIQKYRFLELYRSIERLFLFNVFTELSDTFFTSPSTALGLATKSIGNEREALTSLISNRGLMPVANAIAEKIDTLSGNRLAAALKRKFQAESNELKASGNKGPLYIYYIRCAVVHAGSKDIIFEEFPDGEEMIFSIIREMEALVLSCAGFRPVIENAAPDEPVNELVE